MGIIAEAVRHMLAAGMPGDAVVAAISDMEAAATGGAGVSSASTKSARTERNRRYYERRREASYSDGEASYSDAQDATKSHIKTGEASDSDGVKTRTPSPSASPSPPKETLPTPLKENNPSPPLTPPPARPTERGTRLPVGWVLPDEWAQWCRDEWPNMPDSFIKTQAEQFNDHWRSLPGAKARKADWLAAWRNWMRRSVEMRRQQQTRAGPPPGRMTQADAGRIATEFFRKQAEEGEGDEQSGTGEGERGDRSDAPHVLGRPL